MLILWIRSLAVCCLQFAVLTQVEGQIKHDPGNSGLSSSPPRNNKLLLISFDGFRWDYLNGRAKTPHFNAVKARGVHARKGMKNAFLSNTLPNHMTLVTGLHVESHGIVDNFMYDPHLDQRFIPKYFDKNSYNDPAWHQTVGLPIWVSNQQQLPHGRSGVIMWMGGETIIKGVRPTKHVPHDDDIPDLDKVDTLLSWFTDKEAPINLGVVYFHQPDIWGHQFGPESKEITQKIEELDSVVGYLFDKLKEANIENSTDVIITSDHGFVSVGKEKLIMLDEIIDPQLYEHASFMPGPVAGIIPKAGNEDLIYNKLKSASESTGLFSVYKKRDIPERFHYKNHRRVPPIFAMAKLGYTFLHAMTVDEFWLAGNHGYDNELTEMRPFFMAVGPSFKEGFSVETFPNVDVYPLMCHLLQLNPSPNNGSFHIVSQFLRDGGQTSDGASNISWTTLMAIGILVVLCLSLTFCRKKLKTN